MARSSSFQELSHLPAGGGRRDSMAGGAAGTNQNLVLGEYDMGQLLLLLHRLGLIFEVSSCPQQSASAQNCWPGAPHTKTRLRFSSPLQTHRHFFREETQRWLEQDLVDLLGTDLLVPQQLWTVERMYRTYGFLQHRTVHSKKWRWNWWIGRELLE